MTRDDLIKWARDTCGYSERMTKDLLDAFDAGAAAEREECAKVCQGVVDGGMYDGWQQYAAAACRDAILDMNKEM